jgi:hypothetical protein
MPVFRLQVPQQTKDIRTNKNIFFEGFKFAFTNLGILNILGFREN